MKRGSFYHLFLQVYKKSKEGFRASLLFLSVFFILISSAFEAFSLALIVPLLETVLGGSFESLSFLHSIFNSVGITEKTHIILFTAILVFLSVLFKNIFSYTSHALRIRVAQDTAHILRTKIVNQLLSYDFLFFMKHDEGELQYLTTLSDRYAIAIKRVHEMIRRMAVCIAYLVVMLYLSAAITVFLGIGLGILYISLLWLKKKIEELSEKSVKTQSHMSSRIYELFRSMHLVKSYGTEQGEAARFIEVSKENRNILKALQKKVALIPHIQEPVLMLGVGVLAGISYVFLLPTTTGGIAGFMTFFVVLRRFQNEATNLFSESLAINEFNAPMKKILASFKVKRWMRIPSGDKPFTGLKKGITFKNVSFKYEKTPILKNISFTIKPGENVALIGHSGSGKTTLVSLIPRVFAHQKGQVLLDGVPVEKYNLDQLRSRIGVVSQEVVILDRTVRENLCYGRKDVSEKELIAAVKKTALYDIIKRLPKGFDTHIGEHGVTLSGGQKQRVALARALIHGHDILILDEATSDLDTKTERTIVKTIENEFKKATVFVIAHRLNTINKMDKVLVVEQGKITEKGTVKALLKKKNRFYAYWKLQKS